MNIFTHNGRFTLVNERSGGHRTFRISTNKSGDYAGQRVVSLLNGPDNESDYTAFARIEHGDIVVFRTVNGKPVTDESNFITYRKMLKYPQLYPFVRWMSETTCRKCNRPLTNPVSIETGIGPECGGRK